MASTSGEPSPTQDAAVDDSDAGAAAATTISASVTTADSEPSTSDIPSTRKLTFVEPEKPPKETSQDVDEPSTAPMASTSREGSPEPDEEGEEEEDAENVDNEGNNDEEEDEEDELEEAYFWHDQIIAELRRACRDDDPRKAYAIIDTLSVDRLGRTSYTARAERTGEVVVVKANVLEAPVEKFTGQRLITELFLMRDMLPHPNVVGFYDLYIVQTAEVWLITEYMKDGVTLGEIIANTASKFTEEQIARVCVETCKGLAHLHNQLIIHRDIRSDSIIIDRKGRVKITGFAFSVQLPDKAAKRRTMVSTLALPNRSPYTVDKTHWTAPEVIKRKEYGPEVDVWAFGITLVEMVDGAPPYAGQEPLKVLFLILVNGTPELKEPDALSDELKDFLSDCLAVDVEQRASMSELVEHEFLKKACPPAELEPLFEFKPEPEPEADSAEPSQPTESADIVDSETVPALASDAVDPPTPSVASESLDTQTVVSAPASQEVLSTAADAVDSPVPDVVDPPAPDVIVAEIPAESAAASVTLDSGSSAPVVESVVSETAAADAVPEAPQPLDSSAPEPPTSPAPEAVDSTASKVVESTMPEAPTEGSA